MFSTYKRAMISCFEVCTHSLPYSHHTGKTGMGSILQFLTLVSLGC